MLVKKCSCDKGSEFRLKVNRNPTCDSKNWVPDIQASDIQASDIQASALKVPATGLKVQILSGQWR
jgi:hypothetical protein